MSGAIQAMEHGELLDACWNYATTVNPTERDEIAARVAAHLNADPDRVDAVLRMHRTRVGRLYHDAHGRPSLGSLELQDEAVSDALAQLPDAQVEEAHA